MRGRLEEQLGTRSVIHPIVEIASARSLRLFHARVPAAKVSDARSPHLLAADRRQYLFRPGNREWPRMLQFLTDKRTQVIPRYQFVPRLRADGMKAAFVLSNSSGFRAIQLNQSPSEAMKNLGKENIPAGLAG